MAGTTLRGTNMETQKGAIRTTVLLKRAIWVSMLVWGSVLPLYEEAPKLGLHLDADL